MKILFYDCFSGISGDMNLGAMVDIGVDIQYLQTQLSKLKLDNEFNLKISKDSKKGILGTKVDVVLNNNSKNHKHHRKLKHIESIIENSSLEQKIKNTSLKIFMKLAQAEAKIHGKNIYEIHFHEVGAIDAIVDIVGAAICFHYLNADKIWCSPVELGGGFVKCAHGIMPVPAPATSEILQGVLTTRGAVNNETTTPTGAAILSVLVDKFTSSPKLIVEKTGYGIGHRDTKIPNVLRVQLARSEKSFSDWNVEQSQLLQCNIDDMTPEMLGVIMNLLLEKGAQDVHFTPVIMKKNRPATCISVLCSNVDEDKFKKLLFKHTTTLGIKSFALEKTMLNIDFEILKTPLGKVTMKNAIMDGKVIRSKPELEDCKKLAKLHDISLGEVYYQIGKARK